MRKRLTSIIIAICMFFCMSIDAFAVPTVSYGYAGINNYSYCTMDDRMGVKYVTNLSLKLLDLSSSGYISYRNGEKLTNNEVTPGSISRASRSTFFAYAGHGIIFDSQNNALHTNASEVTIFPHALSGELTSERFNLITTKTRFPHKYVTLYTCNQLTNGGSTVKANNILKMMNGTRLILGFASVMYLDSREASLFGQWMKSRTIMDAFFIGARRYQVQLQDSDSIARVVGYKSASADRIINEHAYAPAAASNLSSFGILDTRTIAHTGQLIPVT